jgi:protein NirF
MKHSILHRTLSRLAVAGLLAASLLVSACAPQQLRGSGDLGVIIERASGSLQIIETTGQTRLARIDGLGDLSHASVVFSRDQRYAYVFGRDGGLSKIDLLERHLEQRIIQAGNSIGGAISQDGTLIAVSNYVPGGVKVFDARTLALVADIPATLLADGSRRSRVVGLVDAPGQQFVFSLFDTGEIWVADFSQGTTPVISRFEQVGKQPYDALITPDGRYYMAGLFGEDGMAQLDLWHPERGVQRVLDGYGRGQQKLPVYKMPHLEGWAVAGEQTFVPAVGQHRVLVLDSRSWQQSAAIEVAGQPVFVMARPDGRQIWVNFAYPDNHRVQVFDSETLQLVADLQPGPAVLHMEFSARGEQLWLSVRDGGQVQVWDPYRLTQLKQLPAQSPSGIFFSSRAQRTGL